MMTITRRAQDLRSRIDAAVAVAVVLSATCLAIAAGAFVAATQATPPPTAAQVSVASEPAATSTTASHDDHMS